MALMARSIWRPLGYLPAVFAGLATALAAAPSEPPAGIVMAIKGNTDPPLVLMAEIPADTPIQLGSASELTFLHYSQCKQVTVAGGTLALSLDKYRTTGRISSEKEAPCPNRHILNSLADSGLTTGGILMRGDEGPARWPVTPEFLLAGSRAEQISDAAIFAEDRPDQPLVRLDLAGRRASAPQGAPAMLPNVRYLLRLTMSDRPEPVTVLFVGTRPTGAGSLVVLRVD